MALRRIEEVLAARGDDGSWRVVVVTLQERSLETDDDQNMGGNSGGVWATLMSGRRLRIAAGGSFEGVGGGVAARRVAAELGVPPCTVQFVTADGELLYLG